MRWAAGLVLSLVLGACVDEPSAGERKPTGEARGTEAAAPGTASPGRPGRTPTATATPRPDPSPAPGVELPACTWVWVASVTDGDTLRVLLGGRNEPVRLIGLDTPEISGGVEPFAREARERLRELVAGGLCLERDVSERDRFGRLLRWLWLPDGRLVNEIMVREGLAVVATFPPDVKYIAPLLVPAEAAAREEGLGGWR